MVKDMEKFTIYCTEEQTRKAYELGAPIELLPNYTEFRNFPYVKCNDGNEQPCVIPTTEEMIGWIEDKNILIEFTRVMGKYAYRLLEIHGSGERNLHIQQQGYQTRKEATLAAIDAALEYLKNNI